LPASPASNCLRSISWKFVNFSDFAPILTVRRLLANACVCLRWSV
jgi:hypothetical protein